MGDEDSNPDIIRKVNKELSEIRKERQIIRRWGIILLFASLLLLIGFLCMWEMEITESAREETAFEYPMPAMPAEEDSSIWITDKISDDVSNTDNADNTEDVEEWPLQTESPSPSAPVVVSPVITRPVTIHSSAARTVKKVVQPRRKKAVAAIPPYIITRPGMTLRSLARLYYGREVFWVYIYDRNIRVLSSLDTSSFDALPSGIELELPRPPDYGIDATEPISLQRACNQAKSLSKQ